MVVQRCFMDASMVSSGIFKELLLHESLKSVTRKIEECFEGVLRVFHRSLKVFQGIFKYVSCLFEGCL